MNATQTRERARAKRARIIEWVYVKGCCYVNVVLPNGKPQTWRVKLDG